MLCYIKIYFYKILDFKTISTDLKKSNKNVNF